MQSLLCSLCYAVFAMQSLLCNPVFWVHLGVFWGHLGVFWVHFGGKLGRDTVCPEAAGKPADGQILSGGVAWQAGGQEAATR